MESRRAQPVISFRSRKAQERLRILTRDGRSQAEVIERALEREPDPPTATDAENERAFQEIMAISKRGAKLPRRWASMAEFDAAEYDERSNCR